VRVASWWTWRAGGGGSCCLPLVFEAQHQLRCQAVNAAAPAHAIVHGNTTGRCSNTPVGFRYDRTYVLLLSATKGDSQRVHTTYVGLKRGLEGCSWPRCGDDVCVWSQSSRAPPPAWLLVVAEQRGLVAALQYKSPKMPTECEGKRQRLSIFAVS